MSVTDLNCDSFLLHAFVVHWILWWFPLGLGCFFLISEALLYSLQLQSNNHNSTVLSYIPNTLAAYFHSPICHHWRVPAERYSRSDWINSRPLYLISSPIHLTPFSRVPHWKICFYTLKINWTFPHLVIFLNSTMEVANIDLTLLRHNPESCMLIFHFR